MVANYFLVGLFLSLQKGPTEDLRLSIRNPSVRDVQWASATWDLSDVTFNDTKAEVEKRFEGHRNDYSYLKKFEDENLKLKSASGYFAAAYASIVFTGHQKGLRPSYRIAMGLTQFYLEPYNWITNDGKLRLTKNVIWLRIFMQTMTGAWQGGTYLAAKRYLKAFPTDEIIRSRYYQSMSNVLLAPRYEASDKPIEISTSELKTALADAKARADKYPQNSLYVASAANLFLTAGYKLSNKQWYRTGIDLGKRCKEIPCLDQYDTKINKNLEEDIKDWEKYFQKTKFKS